MQGIPSSISKRGEIVAPRPFRASSIILLFILSFPQIGNSTENPARPNIVLIMADDMGWSDAGCYGGEIRTPNIDSLASGGIRFTQFYNNSICGPSRASLLTGLYCQQIGHPGNRWNEPKDFTKCATFAELLQDAGYHTMMVGKWQGRDLAVHRGFDRFFGPNCQNMISYYNEVQHNEFYLNDTRWEFPDKGFFMTDAFSDHAVKFLEEAIEGEKPFLLYAAYIAPHWPLHAREKDIAPYRQMYSESGWEMHRANRFTRQREMGLFPKNWQLSPEPADVPPWSDDPYRTWQAERMSVYAGQISCMDRGIGRILDTVKKAGKEENTLVMFLSDNGAAQGGRHVPHKDPFPPATDEGWRLDGVRVRAGSGPDLMPGPHDTFSEYGRAWANVSNTPLSGFKAGTYEGGIRTPLVVRWPEVVQDANGLRDEVSHVIDVMPTLLDVAGVLYPKVFHGRNLLPLEGESLLPAFRGEDREGHEELCWSALGDAIRAGKWKLVRESEEEPWELYDLEADGTETADLASEHPTKVNELAERFEAWRRCVNR